MKILIAADTYYPHVNGASYFTQRLAKQLQDRGHTVLVVAPSKTTKSDVTLHNGITVHGIRSVGLFMPKATGFRYVLPILLEKPIKKIVTDFKPDVVHIQMHSIICRTVMHEAQKQHIRVVGTNHFMPDNLVHYLPLPEFARNGIKNLMWSDFKKVFKKLSAITVPTEAAKNVLVPLKLKQEIQVISNGIDLAHFNPSRANEFFKNRFGITDPVLLYLGRLDKEKCVETLIRAVATIPRNIPLHFAIVGIGAEQPSLEKLRDSLRMQQRISFLGFVKNADLASVYASAYCFAIASIVELQCISAMEAMASRLPVIAAPGVALPELITENENGFLCPSDDSDCFARHITEIFTDKDLRERLAQKSLEFIQKHDINATLASFEAMYTAEK